MPNRMLRDWTESEKMNGVSATTERFFTRLIMKADDYGRFHADPQLLLTNLYPLCFKKMKQGEIKQALFECESRGLITIYDKKGRKYLQILEFRQRLDKARAKYPAQDELDSKGFVNDSMSLKKGIEEKRNEDEGKRAPPPSTPTPEYLQPVTLTSLLNLGKINARDCETVKESILRDELFMDTVCKTHSLQREKASELILKFFTQKALAQKVWDNETDARTNLLNWFPKHLLGKRVQGQIPGEITVTTGKKPQ